MVSLMKSDPSALPMYEKKRKEQRHVFYDQPFVVKTQNFIETKVFRENLVE